MFALDRSSRTLLAVCAFGAFACSFVTTPSAGGASGFASAPIPAVSPRPVSSAFAFVEPHRDPFAGEPRIGKAAAAPIAASPPTAPALPPLPGIPAAIQPLPPNAGAAGSGLPFGPQPRVTAVVTGRHPFALVDEAGTTRVVTIGDRVDGDTIVTIGSSGVRLERGTTLSVAPPSPTALPFPGGRLP